MRYWIVSAVFLSSFILVACHRAADVITKTSPDGTMTLTASVDDNQQDPKTYLCVIVDVRNTSNATLFHQTTPASATQKWSIEWVTNNDIALSSVDARVYHIRRHLDGSWSAAAEEPETKP